MPTSRGWLVAATGVALFAAGVAFGTSALEQLGVALVVLTLLAVVVVRLTRHELAITRTVTPLRSAATQPVTVTIDVVNKGRGPAPLILLEDGVPPPLTATARFSLSGVEPGGHRQASFVLRPTRRGRYSVGPLRINVVDPFALARVQSEAAPPSSFLVHPRIAELALPRDLGQQRNLASSPLRQLTGARGEDFYTLREYVEGDDLRKIHWASTAKRDRYMIRQEETPWQARVTIVLDDRAGAHDGVGSSSSFEHAVEATASLVDLYSRSGYGFRLTAAHRRGLPNAKGSKHRNDCLDLLATIEPERNGGEGAFVGRLVELESASSPEAALVVVAGTLTAQDAVAVTRCSRRWHHVTAVIYPAHRFGSGTTKSRWDGESDIVHVTRLLGRAGVRVIVLGPDESLPMGWDGLWSSNSSNQGVWGPRREFV